MKSNELRDCDRPGHGHLSLNIALQVFIILIFRHKDASFSACVFVLDKSFTMYYPNRKDTTEVRHAEGSYF